VLVGGIDHQWQVDLADVSSLKKFNDGNAFLLTVIDVFSKYVWAVPIARKTQSLVAEAFRSIFEQGRKPLILQTDQGTEFLNDTIRRLLKKEGIFCFWPFDNTCSV
jgi:transposase InsO family protein